MLFHRHWMTFLLSLIVLPLLSGNEPTKVPQHVFAAPTPPPHFAAVRSFFETRLTPMSEAEITAATRTVLVESERAALDPQLVLALIQVESSGNPRALSHMGAMGLMQVRPETAEPIARDLGIEGMSAQALYDPTTNIRIGVHYLRELINRFGSVDTALTAYNCGPTRVARNLRRGKMMPQKYRRSVNRIYRTII
jgi:soluble lytic murein transglycosylase-like protein